MRLILDTNVIVSAAIQKSYPFLIVDRILSDPSFELCISAALFGEYFQVLSRDKFAKFPDFLTRSKILLNDLEAGSSKFTPNVKVDIIKDEPDNRLLELAEVCNADYLITGNSHDFTMAVYKSTRIVSPKEFYSILNRFI